MSEAKETWDRSANIAPGTKFMEKLSNRIIKAIKGDSSWLNKVKEQAIQRGISLEENIIENAIWLETQNKEGRDVK